MFYKKELGQRGENIALKYYQQQGYHKIAQNFYTRYGELDLVLEKNQQILVVEVKTRRSFNYGWAEESISSKKLNNLKKAYQALVKQKKLSNECSIEICVIEIIGTKITIRTFLI